MAQARVISTENKSFKPVVLEVTLESQAELDLFSAIFNYAPIAEFFNYDTDWGMGIREAAVYAGGNANVDPLNQHLRKRILDKKKSNRG